MISTILFDLDGTLLPMDQEEFTSVYFHLLAKTVTSLGYTDAHKLVQAVWQGTAAMVRNDGRCLNHEAFWNSFCGVYGEKARADIPAFDEFYRVEFQQVQRACGFNALAKEAVAHIRALGYRVALATNPIFPAVATHSRVRWAGLDPADFELITTYENSTRCKPNPDYFLDVARALGVEPAACLMVGNDVEEDMVAAGSAGMQTFLLTDCLINKQERDTSAWPSGDFPALERFVSGLARA